MATGGPKTPEAISRIKQGKGDFAKVGMIDEYKVLKYKDADNAKIPLLAGDSEVYIIVNGDNEIKHITFNEDHGISRQIDIDPEPKGIHAHTWSEVMTDDGIQMRRVSKEHESLTEREWAIVNRILDEVESGHVEFKTQKGVVRRR